MLKAQLEVAITSQISAAHAESTSSYGQHVLKAQLEVVITS